MGRERKFRAGRAVIGGNIISPKPPNSSERSPEDGSPPPAPSATQYQCETAFQRPVGSDPRSADRRSACASTVRVEGPSGAKSPNITRIRTGRLPSVEVNRAAADDSQSSHRDRVPMRNSISATGGSDPRSTSRLSLVDGTIFLRYNSCEFNCCKLNSCRFNFIGERRKLHWIP